MMRGEDEKKDWESFVLGSSFCDIFLSVKFSHINDRRA